MFTPVECIEDRFIKVLRRNSRRFYTSLFFSFFFVSCSLLSISLDTVLLVYPGTRSTLVLVCRSSYGRPGPWSWRERRTRGTSQGPGGGSDQTTVVERWGRFSDEVQTGRDKRSRLKTYTGTTVPMVRNQRLIRTEDQCRGRKCVSPYESRIGT